MIVLPALRGDDNVVTTPVDRPQTNSSPTARHRQDMKDQSLIVPGERVGPAKLGETTDRVYKLIEREMGGGKQIEIDSCGGEFIWEDTESRPQGNLIVGILNSAVFQVESGTPRYHTSEGIKAYDSPSQVRRAYPRGLRAYSSLNPTVEALGGLPLIFWVDWHRGLAFVLASTRGGRSRYLYSIIVFKPGGKFCPEGQNPILPTGTSSVLTLSSCRMGTP